MHLRGIDLNLLVILQALLQEGHVSRAAHRLGLSQPATSHALDRCRHLLGDPLLERSGPGMRLTPRAEALREPLGDLLAQAGRLLGAAEPGLADIRRTLRVELADAVAAILVPRLHASFADRAPGLTLAFPAWRGSDAALTSLESGATDIAISVAPAPDADRFRCEPALEEDYVLAMRAGHPAAPACDLATWLAHPHVIVSSSGATRTSLDDHLAVAGHARRVAVAVSSFLLVPELLRASDMMALLPSRLVAAERGAGLVVLPPPLAVPGFTLTLIRARRRDRDTAVGFVAEEIRRLLAT